MSNVALLSIINIRDAQKNKIMLHKITIKTQNIKRNLKLNQDNILIGDADVASEEMGHVQQEHEYNEQFDIL